MIHKPFEIITKQDIDSLIASAVAESTTLEFKQELPGSRDDDKKEFLADVSSFANARGGDILYGVKAKVDSNGKKTGEADEVTPLDDSADASKLRLEEMIRQGIAPRLPVQIREITGWGVDGNGHVILIRVPKSFASPHMVTFKGSSRFFSRNSAGKFQLDVDEIRSAVLATNTQAERIQRFRQDRLAKIVSDDTPVPLISLHRLVMHAIPLPTFLNRERLDLGAAEYDLRLNFMPYGASDWDHRFNLDGFLTWSGKADKPKPSYCQLFFDGTAEAVYADILRSEEGGKMRNGPGLIASVAYEKYAIRALSSYLKGYKTLGLSGPVAVSLSLLGCRGSYLAVPPEWDNEHAIDRDAVILQEVILDSLDTDVPRAMRPLFDQVWNACGFPRSLNYTKDGEWNPR